MSLSLYCAFVAVFAATVMTFAVLRAVAEARRVSGPDSMGAGILMLLALLARWVLVAVALMMAVGAGAFEWVCPGRAGQYALVLIGHVVLGLCSLACSSFLMARNAPATATGLAGAVSVGLPLMTAALVWMGSMPSRPPGLIVAMWVIVGVMFAVALPGPVVMMLAAAKESAARAERREAEEKAKSEQYYAERLAQLDALPSDVELYKLIQFTYANEPGDVAERAVTRILARPAVAEELSAALRGNACLEGLWFLAVHYPEPPASIGPAFADGLVRIGEYFEKQCASDPEWHREQFNGDCFRIVEALAKWKVPPVDFEPSLRRVIAGLCAKEPHSSQDGREAIESWLRMHGKKEQVA